MPGTVLGTGDAMGKKTGISLNFRSLEFSKKAGITLILIQITKKLQL